MKHPTPTTSPAKFLLWVLDTVERAALPLRNRDIPEERERVAKRHLAENLCFDFEECFTVGCTLSVYVRRDWDESLRAAPHVFYTVQVEVGWSATGRNVATALAAVNLYQRVLALAATIDARAQQERIGDAKEALAE